MTHKLLDSGDRNIVGNQHRRIIMPQGIRVILGPDKLLSVLFDLLQQSSLFHHRKPGGVTVIAS
ncbi:hypothetical protein D3C72_2325630 [compost metagenome]